MKKLTLLPIVFLLSFSLCNAQFIKTFLPGNPFSDSLSKVVLDFKYDYKHIQGTNLPAQTQPDFEVYNSKVTVPTSLHCIIYRYHSKEDTTASWQGIMYEGDDYNEAIKAYKNVYHLLKRTSVKWIDKSMISFVGDLELPKENVTFAVSSLHLEVMDEQYQKFVAEVELTNQDGGYVVNLNLQNKRSDTDPNQ
jgi:hypothetical protein